MVGGWGGGNCVRTGGEGGGYMCVVGSGCEDGSAGWRGGRNGT